MRGSQAECPRVFDPGEGEASLAILIMTYEDGLRM